LQAYANGGPFFALFAITAICFVPLSNAAVVSGVSRAYLGMPVRFADCYRDALPRWPSLLGLMLLWLIAAFLAAGVAFMAFFVLSLALAAIFTALGTAGAVLSVLLGIAGGVAILLLALELYLAAAYSFVAAVLEGLGPSAAFGSGFQRVFGEGLFGRSMGIAAAIFGIAMGLGLVGGVIGWTTIALTHSFAYEFAVSAIVNSFTYPFAFAVVAVSYYDVRIRREGFDLQMLASRLRSPAPPSTPAP
jgi:hypothetical protein